MAVPEEALGGGEMASYGLQKSSSAAVVEHSRAGRVLHKHEKYYSIRIIS